MPTNTNKTNLDFIEVSREEVPEGSTGRGQLSPASLALLDGKTIWMAGDRNRSARFARMAKPRHLRVRTRVGERDGTKGTYIWLEAMVEAE